MAPGSCCSEWKVTLPSSHPFQFPDIVEFSETMANAGKTVIVAALDGTFQRKVRCLMPVLRRGLGRHRTLHRDGSPAGSSSLQSSATWMTRVWHLGH